MNARRLTAALAVAVLAAAGGCAHSGPSLEATAPRADQVQLGIAALERKDYSEARELLRGYLDYDPNGERSAEAHYYLGISYFRTKDWPNAATEFSVVVNQFTTSPLVPDARYHLAVSYWRQSRQSPYDQDYTERALREFDRFLSVYPDHPRAEEIRKLRQEAHDRLAKKDYDNGRLYMKLSVWNSALFYFGEVQRIYPESEWAKWAGLREGEVLKKTGRRDEARARLERLLTQDPLPNEVRREAQKLLEELGPGDARSAAP